LPAPVPADGFHPPAWLRGGHRQTVLAYWARRHLRWRFPSEDLVVEAGSGVRLLLRATWQPGPREERPALLIVHGLGGSDASPYVVSAGRHAYARGWHVARMNMRGSGDGFALCPLLYNAGLDTDLLAALSAVAAVVPRIGVLGDNGIDYVVTALAVLRAGGCFVPVAGVAGGGGAADRGAW